MRKCQACGYLVLGDNEVCKHCGADLPRVMASALVPIGAHLDAPASPPPVPPPPPPRFATPPGGGRAAIAREYWTPPPPPPISRTRSTPRAALALIALVSMALGWVAVDQLMSKDGIPAGTSAFVAGHGVQYSSPDHTFEARFPSTPVVRSQPISVASRPATINLAQVQSDSYEVVAASLVLPISVPAGQVESVLHEIMDAGATSQGAKIVSEQKVTRYGVSGIEVRAKVQDGYDARLMVLISGPRVYFLGVHAKRGTDRLYQALVDSLVMF